MIRHEKCCIECRIGWIEGDHLYADARVAKPMSENALGIHEYIQGPDEIHGPGDINVSHTRNEK